MVCCTPGCPLFLWMDMIWSVSSSSTWSAPISGLDLLPFFITSNHRYGTLVSQLAIFKVDGTNVTSRVSSYSFTNSLREFSCLLMSISLAALVCTHVLPVRVSDSQLYVHTGSVFPCSNFPCHWRTKLMPFNTVSSSARLCWALFSSRSQQVSSCTISCFSLKLLQSLENWHQPKCLAPGHPHTNPHGLDHLAEQNPQSQLSYTGRGCPSFHHLSPSWPNLLSSWVFYKPHRANDTLRGAWQASHTKRIMSVTWRHQRRQEPHFLASTATDLILSW